MKSLKEIFDAKTRPASSLRGFASFSTQEIADIQTDARKELLDKIYELEQEIISLLEQKHES